MELTGRALTLPAREADWSSRLRDDTEAFAAMAHDADGPFHVLHPATFAGNVRAFQDVLRDAGVDGRVFFGKKANKAGCWLDACAATGAGVDVASAEELAHALGRGLRDEDLVVTGPAKTTRLLELALRHGALLAVDALDELERLIELAGRTARARLLLRVLPEADPHSRFGLDAAALDAAVRRCVETPVVDLEGFSFHLSGYDPAPRAALAAELAERCAALQERGVDARTVSVGGGFAVSYVDAAHWHAFLDGHDDEGFHAGHRPAHFYPYHQAPTGAAMLAAILEEPAGPEHTVAGVLARAGVRLVLEPGRALLDRCGFSVFPVLGHKPRRGYGIVTVDGLSMSLSEQWKGSEFLPDPLLWPAADDGDPVRVCVGGASCLEYDMLTWRKVGLPRPPRFGDLLVYPNTAGYQMDKNESEFHQRPLPPRYVIGAADDEGRGPTWRRDG